MTTAKQHIPALRFPEFEGEWPLSTLEHLSEKIGDGLHATPQYDDNGDFYFINGNNLSDGKITISPATKRVSKAEYEKHRKALNDRTILMSINGTIGNLAYYNNELVILGKSAAYISIKGGFSITYIFNILQTKGIRKYFEDELTGTTIKNLSLATIRNALIHTPSLPEQQKIAAFLTAVDDKIQQLTRKKALLEQYKKGVMQQLFSQQLRFTDDAGNDFPDWEEKTIDSITKVTTGATPSTVKQAYWDGVIPWMNSGELNHKRVYQVENSITELGLKNSSTKLIPRFCVLIGLAGQGKTRGTVAMNMFELCTNQSIAAIHPNEAFFLPDFLYYNLDMRYDELRALSTGDGGRGGLNLQIIKALTVSLPSIKEQQKIASFLSAIDEKINHVTTQLQHTQQWKKGLLQQMFV